MVKVKLSIYIVISLLVFSCTRKQDMLTIQRQDFIGNELRIDGFYYSKDKVRGEDHYSVYFLYRNGVLFYPGGFTGTLAEVKDQLKDVLKIYSYNNDGDITSWGVFVVENNSITIEKWVPGNGYNAPVVKTQGRIINDTTFLRDKSSNIKYFFTPFSPKPDSTNTFIK